MFSLFKKKSARDIEKSVKKYGQALETDMNLVVKIRYSGKSYTSDVEYVNNTEVLFRCPDDKYETILLGKQRNLKAEFVSYSGLYTTKLSVIQKIEKDEVFYYKCKIIAPIEKNQRRDNYRLPIFLDVEYKLLPQKHLQYRGNTLDISVGGMLMETDEDIHRCKNIEVKINIDGKDYNIKCTVLRKKEHFSNGTYLYNLKFDNLSNRHKNEISRFIFDSKDIAVN